MPIESTCSRAAALLAAVLVLVVSACAGQAPITVPAATPDPAAFPAAASSPALFPANQIIDGDFENALNGAPGQRWEWVGADGTMAIDPGESVSGLRSLKCSVPTAGALGWEPHTKIIGLTVERGKRYTFSAYFKAASDRRVGIDIRRLSAEIFYGNADVRVSAEWREYSWTVSAPESNSGDVMVLLQLGGAAGDLWIDRVRFYEGEYAAAPVDNPRPADAPAAAAASPANAVAAIPDRLTGDPIPAARLLPTTPGSAYVYELSVSGADGAAAVASINWLTLQSPPPDARLAYTYSPEAGYMYGAGRYYNWVNGYYFAPYRFIGGDTRHRGLLDLLALPETLVPGANYTFANKVSYTVAVVPAQDGAPERVRLRFDARGSQDAAYRGEGFYLLEPDVGIVGMEFRHSADGAFGPAGSSFAYRLLRRQTAPLRTIVGRLVDSASLPVASAWATVNSPFGIDESCYIVARCAADGSFALKLYAADAAPVQLNFGVDRDGDFLYDNRIGRLLAAPAWRNDVLDLGAVVYDPPPAAAAAAAPRSAATASIAAFSSAELRAVPGPIVFPTGLADDGQASAGPFMIGRTEVTWSLWSAVYAWARTDAGNGRRADGGPLYAFAHRGQAGSDGRGGADHPVTGISWRDAVVWCNALTEYLGGDLDCVYYVDAAFGEPLRSADSAGFPYAPNPAPGAVDQPFVKAGANGFRLPLNYEWELAARFIADADGDGDILTPGEFYPGTFSSGATGPMLTDPEATKAVTVNAFNSGGRADPVASKAPNALGLYDVNGNVWELCFDASPYDAAKRYMRGQCWGTAPNYEPCGFQLGNWGYTLVYEAASATGFRIARTTARAQP